MGKWSYNMPAIIVQPNGIKYLIQTHHYNKIYAEEYIKMMIDKCNYYIYYKQPKHISIEKIKIIKSNLELCYIKEL